MTTHFLSLNYSERFYCHTCVRRLMETSTECSCVNEEVAA